MINSFQRPHSMPPIVIEKSEKLYFYILFKDFKFPHSITQFNRQSFDNFHKLHLLHIGWVVAVNAIDNFQDTRGSSTSVTINFRHAKSHLQVLTLWQDGHILAWWRSWMDMWFYFISWSITAFIIRAPPAGIFVHGTLGNQICLDKFEFNFWSRGKLRRRSSDQIANDSFKNMLPPLKSA